MTIVVFVLLLCSTIVSAQPTELSLEVVDVINHEIDSMMSPQTGIDTTGGDRSIPIPPGGTFDFRCITSTPIMSSPWSFFNSSSFEDIEDGDSSARVYTRLDEATWILRVSNFSSDLAGVYKCEAEGLILMIELVESNPGVVCQYTDIVTKRGELVLNSLLVTGDPLPVSSTITWYFNGEKLTDEKFDEFNLNTHANSLVFGHASYSNEGIYTVYVSNSKGTANFSYSLTVTGKPALSLKVPQEPIYIGDDLEFVCNDTDGRPDPNFTWFFDGSTIMANDNNDYNIEDYSRHSVLTVKNVKSTAAGVYKCSADNGAHTASIKEEIVVSLLPPHKPTITVNTGNVVYAGTNLTLNCSTRLSDQSYDNKNTTIIWKKNGEIFNLSLDRRISILKYFEEDTKVLNSLLCITPTSILSDTGNYSCSIKVFNDTISSETVASDNFQLEILRPMINVNVIPSATDVINLAPYNVVEVNCTALKTSSNIAVESRYEWLVNGVAISGINVTEVEGSSILKHYPESSGTKQYTCKFVLILPSPDEPLIWLSNTSINVQGAAVPRTPLNAVSRIVSYNSIAIKFIVSSIRYGRERYSIAYGTSSDNLALESAVLQGNSDLMVENEEFEIVLSHLTSNTVYYYSVIAYNSFGFVSSSVKTFHTPRVVLAQIRAGPFRGCVGGRVQDSTNVENFFNEKLSARISVQCDCTFPQENLVNGSLHCTTTSPNTLIYRVYIIPTDDLSSSEAVVHLEKSLESDKTFVSGVAAITVDSSCNISISSLDDPLCTEPTVPVVTEEICDQQFLDPNTTILVAVVVGALILLMILMILAMICLFIYQHKRLKRMSIKKMSNQYSEVNCKSETSFMERRKRSPPAIAPPGVPTPKWEGDVSISDCPAYLYSVKPINDDPSQTIVERQPTPGIYDSIDGGLNNTNFRIQVSNPITRVDNASDKELDDCTSSSADFS